MFDLFDSSPFRGEKQINSCGGDNKNTITISSGILDGGNVAIDTHGDNIATVDGGTIIGDIAANNNSRIFVSGGSLSDDLYGYDDGIVEVSGGLIDGIFGVFDSGTIYFYGNGFSVGGQDLSYGDSLRDYGTLTGDYLNGTITGTLLDSLVLNNNFCIWASTDADIIVVPEPSTLLLLGLGGLFLRSKLS